MPDHDDTTAIQDASDHPQPAILPSPIFDGPLSRAVRDFIARLGPKEALARFLAIPATGPRPLSLERVRRVAAGEVEPTFRMAEVVYDEAMALAARVVPASEPAANPMTIIQPWVRVEPEDVAMPVQPWMR